MENKNTQQPAAQNIVVPENLNPQQALSLLIQGVHFAQSKGVYTLKDAAMLDKAVSVFAEQKQPEPVTTPAPTAEPVSNDEVQSVKQ